MRAGRAVVRVDDDDGDDDGGDDKHHGEEHVFPNERNSAGGGGDQFHNNQQEDSERQQDGDGESHLFTWRHGQRRTYLHQKSCQTSNVSLYWCHVGTNKPTGIYVPESVGR